MRRRLPPRIGPLGRALLLCLGAALAGGCAPRDSAAPADALLARPVPRFDDGTPRLDRLPGERGYWAEPSAASLVEVGVDVAMDERGVLASIADAGKVAPFQAWARALYEYRQKNGLADDPAHVCLPPAGPRSLHTPGGVRIVQDRNYERVYLLFGGGNRNWRVIFLDGREPPDPDEVAGTYFGHSVGRWEDDTLVVESSGYNARFWFSSGGLPHTESLRLTERFSRPAFDTLRYRVTVDDPLTYTRAWSAEWTLHWIEGEEIAEQFCEE